MAIFRGTGGQGDSTTDTTVTTVTEKAAEAASSATSAANSATSASNSATSAETSATNAATSESNAATSATNASTSATAAETAKTAAQAAQTAAETAETNAETAEANAVTAKNQAVSAKDNAVVAQTAAETAETNAETAYANTLAIYGSTTDVQNAVDSASASATTATTKASEAATSATNAANSATSAGTSETNAASSASSAATSAASANSYATDAQTAQTAAETAQAAAEAAEASINGLYLGSLADDPTLDGNGVAVTTGDLYFNTTAQEVRVYTDGDVWEPVVDLGGDVTVNSLTSNNDVVVKGNLEVQGTTITVDSATAQTIDLGDNDRIRLGDSDDLQVYHDGTDSYIANSTGTLKLSGNTDVTGNITVSGTVDGRDVAADGTKLDGIEANADVTDTANVTAAGALMDSEVTNLAQVKAFDSADYATAAQGATADSALQTSGGTLTGDLAFGDNVKAKFGASDDLQIYHDGSASYIREGGPGNLIIQAFPSLIVENPAGTERVFEGTVNGAVTLYYDNAIKLATTSSGVDVTGTVVADNAQFGTSGISSFSVDLLGDSGGGFAEIGRIKLIRSNYDPTGVAASIDFHRGGSPSDGAIYFSTNQGVSGDNTQHRLGILDYGDIEFYEDTGTTAKLTWDASAEELQFKDNVSAYFGDGNDLQIYHNGTNTFLANYQGDLFVNNYSNDKDIKLRTDDGSGGLTDYLIADGSTGEVQLFHYGSEKLATKSTGIDVTGTVTADGLTLANSTYISQFDNASTSPRIFGINSGNTTYIGPIDPYAGGNILYGVSANVSGQRFYTGANERLRIDSAGDISFYDDSGTSQDFYWDASTSRLGIGTTSPSVDLEVNGTAQATNVIATANSQATNFQASASIKIEANNPQFHIVESDGPTDENFNMRVSGGNFQIRKANDALNSFTNRLQIDGGTGDLVIFADDGTSQDFYWDASTSRLGLGTTSPSYNVEIRDSSNPTVAIIKTGVGGLYLDTNSSASDATMTITASSGLSGQADLAFKTGGNTPSEAMRIDSSGNVGIGTTSPDGLLHIDGTSDTVTGLVLEAGANADCRSIDFHNTAGDKRFGFSYDNANIKLSVTDRNENKLLTIEEGGNVGIGTDNPSFNLDVHSGTTDFGARFYSSDSTSYVSFQDNSTTNSTSVFCGAAGDNFLANGKTAVRFLVDGSEAARIDSSGNLLVGTTDSTLYNSTSDTGIAQLPLGKIEIARSGGTLLTLNRLTSDGTIAEFRKDGSTIGSISTSGGTTSYNTTSDYRLKENVTNLDDASDRLSQLQVKRFNLIGHDQTVDGFLAHEVQDVVPEAVTGSKDEVDAEGNPVHQSIDHSKLVPLLTAALQEALSEIDSLKNRVTELEART